MRPADQLRIWIGQSPVHQLIAGLTLAFLVQSLLETAGWLLDWPAEAGILRYLSLDSEGLRPLYQPWTLLTYGALHNGLLHFVFNALTLYFTASLLETLWPSSRILKLFVVGVFVGGLGAWLAGIWRPAWVVGASAGVYAVFTAAAARMPDFKVRLFMVLELKLWIVLAILLGMDVIGLFSSDTTARAAHLAGAAAGWFFAARPHLLDVSLRRAALRRSAPKSKLNVVRPHEPSLDQLLDKISAKGYESLTANERKALARHSQKK
ncbi:MAG: rhomboid family intramembrane serine protease [Schleiferiaceae bacterium]